MAKFKITVTDECIGDGLCVDEAPNTFEMNDDNVAFVKDAGGDNEEAIMAAAEGCPVDAIIVVDEESGKQVYPEE